MLEYQVLITDKPETDTLDIEDLLIDIAKFNYGSGKNNPIDNVRFFNKLNPETSFEMKREQVYNIY